MRIVSSENIQTLNHVKQILDQLRNYVKCYESTLNELSEDESFGITMQLCEIEEFIIGKQLCTGSNMSNTDIRLMCYWDYINENCDFDTLIEELGIYEGGD